MDYIKQLNAFYSQLEYNPVSANAIALWSALLHIANKTGWLEYFTVSNKMLEVKSGLENSSLKRARNELVQKKLLEYKKGTGGHTHAGYSIPVLYGLVGKPVLCEPVQYGPVPEPVSEPVPEPVGGPVPDPSNKHKQNINKTKDIIPPNPHDESEGFGSAPNKPPTKSDAKSKLRDVWDKYSFPPSLHNAIKDWLKYKSERSESYKPQGLNSLLKQIENKTQEHGEEPVISLITECMANNWQGIIWDRIKRNGGVSQQTQKQFKTAFERTVETARTSIEKYNNGEMNKIDI